LEWVYFGSTSISEDMPRVTQKRGDRRGVAEKYPGFNN
jgi:hypothetical protein